jgi:hypothetical protein
MNLRIAILIFCVLLSLPGRSSLAQGLTVPDRFKELYAELESQLDSFDQILDPAQSAKNPSVIFSAELLSANAHNGAQLLRPLKYDMVLLELDRLREMGIKGVVVSIGFPLLYPPFHKDRQIYETYLNFYKRLVNDIRKRDLKLIIKSAALFSRGGFTDNSLNPSEFYKTLNLADYIKARTEMMITIVHQLRPDYLSMGSEPDTEAAQTGQPLNEPAAYTRMVNFMLRGVKNAGSRGIRIGAGVGTWLGNYDLFVWSLAKFTKLDFIDIHVYPVNRDYLTRINRISGIARIFGKGLAISEAWLYKVRDEELGREITPQEIFARDTFRFWGPLDEKFIRLMVKLSRDKDLEFFSLFWTQYFFAYLDYDRVKELGPLELIRLSSVESARGIFSASFTDPAKSYSDLIR